MGRPTDHCNLDLWKLHEDVAFGRANGMVIWQPRILAWFDDRRRAGEPLPGRFKGANEVQMYRELGCSNRIYEYNRCFQMVDHARVTRSKIELDATRTKNVIETPVGMLSEVLQRNPDSWYQPAEKHWIETPDDMRIATWLMDNSDWQWDQRVYDELVAKWGRVGAPTMYMPRVNVEYLYLNVMNVESATFAIYEWGGVVKDFFRALHENQLRMIDVINHSPIRIINFGDNLHCATLSPDLYEKYVLPAYLERCERLHRAGKFVCSHWDGEVKSLLKFARVSGLDGIEAITPKPQGDVTLEEVKEALGDDVYLLDGIPAVLFDTTFPEEELIACTEKVIELFAPKLILGISDEMSAQGEIERVAAVGRVVDDYNAAIADKVGAASVPRRATRGGSSH
jgi:hypothetical protein